MKVLWIANFPLGKHREMLGAGLNQSGGWLETAYASLRDASGISLAVATIYSGLSQQKSIDGRHVFYLVPSEEPIGSYDSESLQNRKLWHEVIDDFNPDIVQIWGTEYALGLCVQKIAQNIPSVVYMQGQMAMIANDYLNKIIDIMNSTKEHYQCEAGDEMRRRFNEFSADFPIVIQNIENYAYSLKKAKAKRLEGVQNAITDLKKATANVDELIKNQ